MIDHEGILLLYDGHHRFEALLAIGIEEVMVLAVEVSEGDSGILEDRLVVLPFDVVVAGHPKQTEQHVLNASLHEQDAA